MDAFLKTGKLTSSKAGTSTSSQKAAKDKKQKGKPIPWVEKVNYFGGKLNLLIKSSFY
jgi:hypothetical protein